MCSHPPYYKYLPINEFLIIFHFSCILPGCWLSFSNIFYIKGSSLSGVARIDEPYTFCGGCPTLIPPYTMHAAAPENTAGLPPSTWGDLTVTEDPTMPVG